MKAIVAVCLVAVLAVGDGVARAASPEPPLGASSCSGCHAAKPGVDSPAPRLAGRLAADIIEKMRAFKSGQRPAMVMDRIAKGFTDAEIETIAAWYAQQQ